MKKYGLVLLAFLLFFANVPLISAQEVISEVQEAIPYSNSQHISWVAQKFGVFKSWIRNELAKGYTLTHIYEGLLQEQQGRSYEMFMQLRYPHSSEAKVRQKRNPILVRGVVVAGTIAVRVAKPYVDDAVRAAKPYVKTVADDFVDGAKSLYKNITRRNSVRNIQTDVPKRTFEKNLESNGWSRTVSKDGRSNIFTKDGAKYSTRSHSKHGSKTADYTPRGRRKPSTKFRLGD